MDAYEKDILDNPNATERTASAFFERFPKFLFLGAGHEVRKEVLLIAQGGNRVQRVDFLRRPYTLRSWDIIELKHQPFRFAVNVRGQHPRLSSAVEAAARQARDYRDIIIQDRETRSLLLNKGIYIQWPRMIVVVGRRDQVLAPATLERLVDSLWQCGVEAWSYDDIFEFAKEHYRENRLIVCCANMHAREDLVFLPRENLRSVHLEDADLRGVDLQCVDLRNAHLDGANLEGANLEGADLEGATLRKARTSRTILSSFEIRGGRLSPQQAAWVRGGTRR